MKSPDDSNVVRVGPRLPRVNSAQMTLFPKRTPDVVVEAGVRAVDVDRLYDAGLLSFDPRQSDPLGPFEEVELRFLASLLRAGCDLPMVRALLADLDPPYHYDVGAMVYDFAGGRWLGMEHLGADEAADLAIERAVEEDDTQALARLGHAAIDALLERANIEEED